MVLLKVLHRLAAKHGWPLVVAHFNHQLRGADSDADEQFVREIALKLKLEFIAERAEVPVTARREKISVEMAARKLRHDFLARTGRRLKIKTVALAHHADDQVELFFLRLLRGAGGEGMAGMKWSCASSSDPAIGLVRPLLGQPKAALRRFAEEQGVAFREDATNAQLDFLRNRIRNKLLPLLARNYQPALARLVARTMDIAGAEAEFVRQAAEDWLRKKPRTGFERLHPAVQRQAIQIQLLDMKVTSGFDLVEQLRGLANRPVAVGPSLALYRDSAGQIVKQMTVRPLFKSDQILVDLKGKEGTVKFGGLQIRWQISPGGAPQRMPKFTKGCEYFDADKVGSPIVLRHWRAGDRMQPMGMKGPVKLQDLFVNRKIPRARRSHLVVATADSGELFWVQGLRIAESFKLDNQTVRRLKWRYLDR